ncbi:MAG TPA: GGDEF domain-containing protein, partial [Longimicrobiales bacterium]
AVPGAAVLCAAAAGLIFAADSAAFADASRAYVYVALGAALLVAWRLHCSRLFLAGLAVSAIHLLLTPRSLGANGLAHALIATLLPIGLALLALDRNDGFGFARLRRQSALLFGPLALGAFLCAGRTDRALQLLSATLINPAYTDWTRLSQPALVATVVSFAVLAVRALQTQRATEAGLAWMMLALVCALAGPSGSTARAIWVLAAGVSIVVALVETAHALAFHDELTGLPSRRALARVRASLEPPYALAVVDVDHFKSFNDQHGHDVGDQVLRMVASRLREVGGGGRAFRSGGEEFTLVFVGSSKQQALPHVEAVRAAVEQAQFAVRNLPRPRGKHADAKRGRAAASGARLRVTISVGVAAASARSGNVDSVLKAADKAMYRAKHEGRNRVVA